MRIVRNGYKFLFLFAAFVVLGIGTTLLGEVPSLAVAAAWIGVAVTPLVVVVATRVFRVPEEDIVSPRPLWRMTGRPTAGFVLGSILALNIIASVWIEIYGRTIGASDYSTIDSPGGLPVLIVDLLVSAVIAVLYYRSSIRLNREGSPAAGAAPVG